MNTELEQRYGKLMQIASHKLTQAQANLEAIKQAQREPIAIIGMGCRLPGEVETAAHFWRLLYDGVDAITEVPSDRWDIEAHYHPDPDVPGKMYTRHSGFLNQVDHFDAQFFGLSPRETISLDPQQRLLLEVSWEALEVAGVAPDRLNNSPTGVFIGICGSDYHFLLGEEKTETDGLYTTTGNALSVAAGRLAYTLGLTGPCLAIDTACSSSLVAIHQACVSLRQGECDLALAGGVNLILRPDNTIYFSQARMLAPDGRCKTFDAAANGYVRSEGCGVVVLKRLSQAQADNDPILAVIRGSMINQDGRSSGLTAPNGSAQEAVIRQALQQAQVEPAQISYIEAHGTGTALGDPIEIDALSTVFSERDTPLWVGSVKTNIGHLEGAAGVAGLIKVILSLQEGIIPPHLHFHNPNPYIDWAPSPVQIPTEPIPWPEGKRIAGISSFGFSGTNAHLVVEQAPDSAGSRQQAAGIMRTDQYPEYQPDQQRPYHLLTLSAKDENALQALGQRYRDYLTAAPEVELGDVCYTTHTGRAHFAHRLAVGAASLAEMQEKLRGYLGGRKQTGVRAGYAPRSTTPQLAFLFSGQGSQYVEMGRELYDSQPAFRHTLDGCADILDDDLDIPLLEVLYPNEPGRQVSDSQGDNNQALISQTSYTQPALFALEYALAQLWQSWGVKPRWLIGHSLGEVVAATVAGVFSLEDGLKLAAVRGRLMQSLTDQGLMVAVSADETTVRPFIAPWRDSLAIAAINTPHSVVISGQPQAVQQVVEHLTRAGLDTTPLDVSRAFHSPLMEPMLSEFEPILQELTYNAPRIKLISTVTGLPIADDICTPDYWLNQIHQPVRFAQAMATLAQTETDIFLEVGPSPTLLSLAQQCLPDHPGSWLPSLRPANSDWRQMSDTLAQLYVRGLDIDWPAFETTPDPQPAKVVLPTYPFQRHRYWVKASAPENQQQPSAQAASPVMALVETGQVDQLAQLLSQSGSFSSQDNGLVVNVLQALVDQHQRQRHLADLDDLLYQVIWQPLALEPGHRQASLGRWLILADPDGLAQTLADHLSLRGGQPHLVYPSTAQTPPSEWMVDPADPVAFTDLLQRLAEVQTGPLQTIVWLWGLDAPANSALSLASLQQAQQLGCGALLHLLQALLHQPDQLNQPKLWLVTRGTQAVLPEVEPRLAQAPLWGLGRVIGLEHPELWGGLLDLSPAPEPDFSAETETILAHLLHPDQETQVAWRDGQRFVPRLVAAQLESPSSQPPLKLEPEATYLITGGVGALGLQVAAWLADQGVAHLVLTSRHGLTTTSQHQAVERLQTKGVDVQVAQVDVADQAQMTHLFQSLTTTAPPLRGVIHAAGVSGGFQLIQDLDRPALSEVMQAKVAGAWVLHHLTQDMTLDFFVTFSSAASVWGGKGQGHYAAANHFLDILAHYRHSLDLPALTINWGPWAGEGMASPEIQRLFDEIGLASLLPDQAMTALAYLMGITPTQMTVANVQWHRFREIYEVRAKQPFLARIEVAASPPDPSPVTKTPDLLLRLQAEAANDRPKLLLAHLQDVVAHI
ncbi:MAG: SDR family NAD(P)-dependent oxidoreductase, partial [Gammaproteobacteria bacterium]|nr:SDR family NAD(P)-dependent oxidoreductase [Gammaproteobacteria bacterium]